MVILPLQRAVWKIRQRRNDALKMFWIFLYICFGVHWSPMSHKKTPPTPFVSISRRWESGLSNNLLDCKCHRFDHYSTWWEKLSGPYRGKKKWSESWGERWGKGREKKRGVRGWIQDVEIKVFFESLCIECGLSKWVQTHDSKTHSLK